MKTKAIALCAAGAILLSSAFQSCDKTEQPIETTAEAIASEAEAPLSDVLTVAEQGKESAFKIVKSVKDASTDTYALKLKRRSKVLLV